MPEATQAGQTIAPPATRMSAPTFTMRGAFDIPASDGVKLAQGTACKGTGTYSDAAAGTPVRVYNGNGEVVAQGALPNGIFQVTPIGSACVFSITVSAVPDGLLQYGVQIGEHGVRPVKSDEMHAWVFLYAS
ncbi:hypothetical protein [Amycolatopsis sp. WGS_07]|uniref:hypothetical protein n=1 Tax=Amycolatopsis sp. WGS_07 TaxID=3076764 RepID=UPI003872F148